MPKCTRCEKKGFKCLVAPGYSRCSECIRVGGRQKCDVHGPSEAEWKELEKVEKKLSLDWHEAQSEQQLLFARLSEMSAKLARIEKQREMFRSRAAEMLRRGLKSIAELDAVEEAERVEAEQSSSTEPEPTDRHEDPSLLWDPESDPVLSQALASYDPGSVFWSSLEIPDYNQPAVPGTGG